MFEPKLMTRNKCWRMEIAQTEPPESVLHVWRRLPPDLGQETPWEWKGSFTADALLAALLNGSDLPL